ncbi:SEC-C metal-binding domain-containing protein [Plantactinospora sp. CA-290183]|uniref:SEC-C metal-binding domain-containing protein n=1 Tax=Plantactinospora sp. CA-290183 TaxID=3240006 RepID=UPI003D8D8B95
MSNPSTCQICARSGSGRARYSETIAEQGVIAWPPPRNGPCWCGSGTKYKKCCGRVA